MKISMKKTLGTLILFGSMFAGQAFADLDFPNIDRTDKVSERRYLDSLNVYNRRPIRVNQSGFRPQDHKYAYVADPSVKTFSVIDANTGKVVEAGNNTLTLLDAKAPKPNIWVNGAFNSLDALYEFGKNAPTTETEVLYKADFSGLTTVGEYYIVVGNDTSATFYVHPSIFNAIFENSLKFFGIQRCGNTKSHMHAACHLKDGSAVGHDLTGGWHDCGDHFKPSETIGYAAYAMATTYLVYQDKAEDRYGNSYADTTITDGIPDILYEAKIGADYIFKLYKASKADGLIAKNDMYHTVGSEVDHQFWDVPEKQDAQKYGKGGPDRDVTADIGTYSGAFAAALAYFSAGWQVYDPIYADSLLEAAKDIYANVLIPHTPAGKFGYTKADIPNSLYPGGSNESNLNDDAAAAALALWYATKDTTYQYDLYKNTKINDNATNYMYNNEPGDAGPYFKAGFLGMVSGFYPGGWMTDYENTHAYVLFSFVKLILEDEEVAKSYNVGELERDTLIQRATNALRRLTDDGSQGNNIIYENRFGSVKAVPPYNLVWTSSDWGFNRYNIGAANAIFMLSEITTGAEKEAYLNLALDNIYYNLGANPWDISFIMGAGDKNQNHPHNRTANPDGYNAGGMPYPYRCPRGALMGGAAPTNPLLEDWKDYTATETCIDFSVQLLMPAQSLAATLPVDKEGPLFSNIAGTPISDTEAIVSWDANEVALVTVFYNTTPDAVGAQSIQQTTASKGGALTLEGLTPGQTYYFFLEGMDTKRNLSTDDNHGLWYQFTMTPTATTISGVTICQVDNRSAKIYWWSSDRMNGIVNYGTSTSALTEAQAAEGGAVMFHEATLTNLKPGTQYFFSISSGATTDKNGGSFYSFKTEDQSAFVNLDIYVKPSNKDASGTRWQDSRTLYVSITNNDTIPLEDFEVRVYLNNPNLKALGNAHQNFGGDGQMGKAINITFADAQSDGLGGYYLPIHAKGILEVSGQLIIETIFMDYNPSVKTTNFGELDGSWSLRPHTDEDDPEKFNGIDLTKAPYYTGSETTFLETVNGVKEVAYTRDPYIAVYYHDKHIYGYSPDYTPENGPQTIKTVNLNFTSPFVTPISSVEKEDAQTSYAATSSVTPTGILDDFEMNSISRFGNTMYAKANRKDSLLFSLDTTLSYGNNYMEFVSWHNHSANTKGSYDCACAVARTNVEIDTIVNPPEQRFLVFTVDTVFAYTGKMTEVHVQLFDSTMSLLTGETVNVILSTGSGFAKFYTSATATIPTEHIDIVNGEGVFYISSDKTTETVLRASGNNSATYNYTTASAVLIVSDTPPWPIIDDAKMVDLDCDNIPDAIQILLSNEYQADQSFSSVTFEYEGAVYETTKVISLNGKDLVVGISIPNAKIDTKPFGKIKLSSKVGKDIKTHEGFYQDGIPPTLLSVSVLEKLPDATSDKVYLQFSEPVAVPDEYWPVSLFATDKVTPVAAPKVITTKIYNDSLHVWEFEVALGTVSEGMHAQLKNNNSIKDKSGNEAAGTCGQPILPITLKLLPVPMTYAIISDLDDDGLAEHVDIAFEREVDSRHTPDSISVIFGTTEPETLWVAGSQMVMNATATEATIDLATPFGLGRTSGNYEGISRGVEVTSAGLVTQHLGTGAAYESNSALGEDKVGPVIASATVMTSKSGELVILNVYISEPYEETDVTQAYYDQKQGDKVTSIKSIDVKTMSILTNGQITVGYDAHSELAPNDGDFVRLLPKLTGAIIDKNGNAPATNAPWVPISNNGKPKIKFKVELVNNITTSSNAVATAVPNKKNTRVYIQNPRTKSLDLIQNGNVIASNIDSTALQGAIWKIEMTVPRGASSMEAAAWDSLRVRYNLPIYSNIGNYVNRLTGKFNVSSAQYLSTAGKVIFFAEWASMPGTGIQSEDGQSVGTGAYIYKAQLNTTFVPNKTKDPDIVKKFSSKNSYDKTATFGIKRAW